jgi:poly-D-alanine transfer protein DltD
MKTMETEISGFPQEPNKPTPEQLYFWRRRELLHARIRAAVVRNQIARAYEILEQINFESVGDTAFRDKITGGKRELEEALNDFLLRDEYWEEKIKKHHSQTPEQYDAKIANQQGCGLVQDDDAVAP